MGHPALAPWRELDLLASPPGGAHYRPLPPSRTRVSFVQRLRGLVDGALPHMPPRSQLGLPSLSQPIPIHPARHSRHSLSYLLGGSMTDAALFAGSAHLLALQAAVRRHQSANATQPAETPPMSCSVERVDQLAGSVPQPLTGLDDPGPVGDESQDDEDADGHPDGA